ncbi:hypothetical protein SARC_08409 [Sphaeroforma arctica JP610]|uniref:Uncharacterized protein n=1 Tax=Sphaeroforma arctica JP610 TaxID=667725 RepID=A0A0L0FRK1_9EUKA|nr:hypothetical protein SARC_08409 [Sphaeroforma arctica JP610]KNC79186.1 hypothetical protein SARC_08409 [Sphaeroforma arctica JP610]|eukprot:XP_014153088.1 hypothetical protein SARC_08409 [Sphaeroforma arctica JP610]
MEMSDANDHYIDFVFSQDPIKGRKLTWLSLGRCNVSTDNTELSAGVLEVKNLPYSVDIPCKSRFMYTVEFQECFNDGGITRTATEDGSYWLYTGSFTYGFESPIGGFEYDTRSANFDKAFAFQIPRQVEVTLDNFDSRVFAHDYYVSPVITVENVVYGEGAQGTSTITLKSVIKAPFTISMTPEHTPTGKLDSALNTRNVPSVMTVDVECTGNRWGDADCTQILTFTVSHNGHCTLDGLYLFEDVPIRCQEGQEANCPSSFITNWAITLDSPVLCTSKAVAETLKGEAVSFQMGFFSQNVAGDGMDAGAIVDVTPSVVFSPNEIILLEFGMTSAGGWQMSGLKSLTRRIKECSRPRLVVTNALKNWTLVETKTKFRGFLELNDDVTCSKPDVTVTLIFQFGFKKLVRRRRANGGWEEQIIEVDVDVPAHARPDSDAMKRLLRQLLKAEDDWVNDIFPNRRAGLWDDYHSGNINYAAVYEEFVDPRKEIANMCADPELLPGRVSSIGVRAIHRGRRDGEEGGGGSMPLDVGNGTETPEGGMALPVPVVGEIAITGFQKGLTNLGISTITFKSVLQGPYYINTTLDWVGELFDHWDEGVTGYQPNVEAAVITPTTCSGNTTCVQTWTVDLSHEQTCQLQGRYKYLDMATACQDSMPVGTDCTLLNFFSFEFNITDINVCDQYETFIDGVYVMSVTADRDAVVYGDTIGLTIALTEDQGGLGAVVDSITLQAVTSTVAGCQADVNVLANAGISHFPGELTAAVGLLFDNLVACEDPGLGESNEASIVFTIDVDYSFNSARRRRRTTTGTGEIKQDFKVEGVASANTADETEESDDGSGACASNSRYGVIMITSLATLMATWFL